MSITAPRSYVPSSAYVPAPSTGPVAPRTLGGVSSVSKSPVNRTGGLTPLPSWMTQTSKPTPAQSAPAAQPQPQPAPQPAPQPLPQPPAYKPPAMTQTSSYTPAPEPEPLIEPPPVYQAPSVPNPPPATQPAAATTQGSTVLMQQAQKEAAVGQGWDDKAGPTLFRGDLGRRLPLTVNQARRSRY